MPDINITVAHKVAVSDTQSIVCDNSDYTVHWTLDEDWSAYDTKTMRTIYMDGTYTDTVFSGDTIELPVCTVPGAVQIGLFAGDIRTSRVAILRALPSVRSGAGAPSDPTPDVYDQLMELIKGLGFVDPEDIAKAVADYLAAHPIEETDPTVPEWAKAETKPTYSAAEVGAIAQSDLQAATDAALAQAKSSGEFDGATGPAGPQGPAGAPGKDGTPGADGVTPHIGDNGNWYIGSTDTGKPSKGEQGPGAEVFYIDLAGNYPNYTCPVDMADIKAAYEAGKVLKCRCSVGSDTIALPLMTVFPFGGGWVFSTGAALSTVGQEPSLFTVAIAEDGVSAEVTVVVKQADNLAFPNPNALTIKIGDATVTYDGSSAQTVEIADGSEVSY